MISKNRLYKVLPEYTRMISDASNPVFKTCEVLRRIDNLFMDESHFIESEDKIILLKGLRKKLELNLSETYLINRFQNDTTRSIMTLIDKKIEEYSLKKEEAISFPKIYERKSWWR